MAELPRLPGHQAAALSEALSEQICEGDVANAVSLVTSSQKSAPIDRGESEGLGQLVCEMSIDEIKRLEVAIEQQKVKLAAIVASERGPSHDDHCIGFAGAPVPEASSHADSEEGPGEDAENQPQALIPSNGNDLGASAQDKALVSVPHTRLLIYPFCHFCSTMECKPFVCQVTATSKSRVLS